MAGVIITGGSSGIGEEMVKAFAEAGWDVGLTWNRGEDAAQEVAAEAQSHGVHVAAVRVQMDDPDSIRAGMHQLMDRVPDVSALVNNAGVNRRSLLPDETPQEWGRVMQINALAPLLCTQAVSARWIADGVEGRVVNVSSVLDRVPVTGGSAYCMSKAALTMLTRVLALELAPSGISVVGLSPGETATPMVFPDVTPGERVPRPIIPLGYSGVARDVARVAVDLCRPHFRYVTGDTVVIDGGLEQKSGPDSLQDLILQGVAEQENRVWPQAHAHEPSVTS